MDYQTKLIAMLHDKIRNITPEKWLSIQDVARLLGVSERKVRTLKESGKLGFIRQGKNCKFKAKDVCALPKKEKNG